MKIPLLISVALLSISCATATKQTDQMIKERGVLAKKTTLTEVPLVKQATNHCGPASLAMVMKHAGRDVPFKEISSQVFTREMKGSFKSDMLSAVRRQGMLGIPIKDLKSILTEVSAGHPVIVFQNLGFSWWPKWHYAVVVGHDLNGPDIILHTGDESFVKTDMRLFERSWILGGEWALLVLPPEKLAQTADETSHAEAAAMLETVGEMDQAQIAYQSMLERWPKGLSSLIGLGNVTYSKLQFKQSVEYLEKATKFHPESAIAWHNLATAQGAVGELPRAKQSSIKAIELSDSAGRPSYEDSLKEWLE
jgi:hypothetical protein